MMPFGFSAGPVQIATCNFPPRSCDLFTLPPHAPCRLQRFLCRNFLFQPPLPPHAPCRLQPKQIKQSGATTALCLHTLRADCNAGLRTMSSHQSLCLHTLRADCNWMTGRRASASTALPPHAPCRLQQTNVDFYQIINFFASTRSVQIATSHRRKSSTSLSFASTRSVQIATRRRKKQVCP